MVNHPVLQLFPNWKVFEFVTKKRGAIGPTMTECIGYYQDKWESLKLFFRYDSYHITLY